MQECRHLSMRKLYSTFDLERLEFSDLRIVQSYFDGDKLAIRTIIFSHRYEFTTWQTYFLGGLM